MNTSVKDRIGERVGLLTVIKRADNKIEISKSGKTAIRACWVCQCDCGNIITTSGHNLSKALSNPDSTAGTKSCGCLRGNGNLSHGKCKEGVYASWHQMLQRCTNKNSIAYPSYGGRGITVCDKWLKFEGFLEDMGERESGLTIDRIDNSKGYYKENCKWATRETQANNRRTNVILTYNGKSLTISQWARETGLTKNCLTSRINRGWDVERALTT